MLNTNRSASGFSMIEVLIALVIISVGFLATARMQIEGLRSSQSAYFNSQANFMVREMADRIRANAKGVENGAYNSLTTSIAAATNMPSCIAAELICSPNQIAEADIAAWSQHLHPTSQTSSGFVALLPSGDTVSAMGSVSADGSSGVFTVSVTWSEYVQGTEETQQMSVQVYP